MMLFQKYRFFGPSYPPVGGYIVLYRRETIHSKYKKVGVSGKCLVYIQYKQGHIFSHNHEEIVLKDENGGDIIINQLNSKLYQYLPVYENLNILQKVLGPTYAGLLFLLILILSIIPFFI